MGKTYSDGYIKLNDYYLNGEHTTKSLSVIIHELGHALGLGHLRSEDIMYKACQSKTTLSTNDKRSYDSAYNRY